MTAQRNKVATLERLADTRSSFLEEIQINFGPVQLLGRFFIEANNLLLSRGIQASFGTLQDAIKVKEGNDDSWYSFPPMLDPNLCGASNAESFSILGRDATGEVVTVQAARLFGGSDTLESWLESGRFIYGQRSEVVRDVWIDAHGPTAKTLVAPFVYSGAIWVHPRHRGAKLAGVLGRLSRAYQLARWNPSFVVAFVSTAMANSSMPKLYGFSRIEPGVTARTSRGEILYEGCLMWMDQAELCADLSRYLVDRLSQIDVNIVDRTADQRA